jgi:putative aldouronate transport system substrate-binding protein
MAGNIYREEDRMKRQNKGLLAVLLFMAAAMLYGGGKAASTQGRVAPGPRAAGPNYWLVPYQTPVTIHVANRDAANMLFEGGDSMSNNVWTRAMKRDLNIDVVTDWISADSEYTTKLNLAIASGQLPDVYYCNSSQFRQLLDAGLTADITGYIEDHASDTLKAIMAFEPDVTNSAKRNGKLYGMPGYGYGPITAPQVLWIRRDWMRSSGLQEPRTIADLEKIMQTFMQAHPGTYGMALNRNLEEMYRFGPAVKAYPNEWITGPDGTIVYGATLPEMKALLTLFADWYKKGYIKNEFMSMHGGDVRSDLVAGKYGVEIFPQWWGYSNGADVVNNLGKEAYFEAYELPTADGQLPTHVKPFDNEDRYIVINKNFKNPEAAIKCMSYNRYIANDVVVQKIMTVRDIEPYTTGDREHLMQMFKIADPVDEINKYLQVQEAKRTGNTSIFTSSLGYLKYQSSVDFVEKGEVGGIGNFLQGYADRCAYKITYGIVQQDRFIPSRMLGPQPEALANFGSTLSDLLTEGFTKIVIGEQPLSYYDTLIREWRAAGGDTATAAVNKEYGGR